MSLIVAHLSDVHALHLGGTGWRDFLSHKRIGGAVNLLLNRRNKHPVAIFEALIDDLNRLRPDHVVITGDLTNLSLASEFSFMRGLLDRIALGPDNVTIIPGNHDVYTWAAQRARGFETWIGPYARSDGQGEVTFPIVRQRGALTIVGLSSARPSPVPFADGRLGQPQIDRAESALRDAKGHFRMVLIHHPPVDNRHVFLRGLRDRAALQAALARSGAELILHGHEHRDLGTTVPGPAGPIPVLGVGSATYDDPRPERRARYNLIAIDGLSFTVTTRVHDAATGAFGGAAGQRTDHPAHAAAAAAIGAATTAR